MTLQIELINPAIDKFKNHPSISLIQSKVENDSTLSFNEASSSDMKKNLPQQNLYFQKYTPKNSKRKQRMLFGYPAKTL